MRLPVWRSWRRPGAAPPLRRTGMVRMCVGTMCPGPQTHGVSGGRQEGGLPMFDVSVGASTQPHCSPADPPARAAASWLFEAHARLVRKVVAGLAEAHGATIDTSACPPTVQLATCVPTATLPRTQAPGEKKPRTELAKSPLVVKVSTAGRCMHAWNRSAAFCRRPSRREKLAKKYR